MLQTNFSIYLITFICFSDNYGQTGKVNIGQYVKKNPDSWISNDFDSWGSGEGVG